MSEKEKLILVGAKVTPEKTARIDARWPELDLPNRSAYIHHLIDRDLSAALGTPLFKEEGEGEDLAAPTSSPLAPEGLQRLLEDAVYVILSAGRRVATSAQAAAVVNDVLRTGTARRELESFLASRNGEGVES